LWIIIFPEGTRVVAGETRKFGVSGALLATETGKLIVPLSHNAGEFWPRRGVLSPNNFLGFDVNDYIADYGRNSNCKVCTTSTEVTEHKGGAGRRSRCF